MSPLPDIAPNYSPDWLETYTGAIIALNTKTFYRSTDGGQTWVAATGLPDFGNEVPASLWLTNDGHIIATKVIPGAGTTAVYYSLDDGTSWQKVQSAGVFDSDYGTVFVTPAGTLLTSSGQTIRRATDWGAGLQQVPLPAGSYTSTYSCFTQLASGRILVSADPGLLYSDDDGATWAALDPANPQNVQLKPVPPGADGAILADRGATVRSTDGGLSWSFSAHGLPAPAYSVKFASATVLYAETSYGIWASSDAGESWSLFFPADNTYFFPRVVHAGIDTVIVAGSTNIWSTFDGGQNFSDITPPKDDTDSRVQLAQLEPGSGVLLVSTDSYEFFRSADLGATWSAAGPPPVSISRFSGLARHPSGRLIIASDAENDVWLYSDNDGLSWQTATWPGVQDFQPFDVKVAPDGTIYVSGRRLVFASHVFCLLKSTDAGATWTYIPIEETSNYNFIPDIAIGSNGHLYVCLSEKILLSINGGLSWQVLPRPGLNTGNYPYINIAISPDQYLYATVNEHPEAGLIRTANRVFEGAYLRGSVRVDADGECSTSDAQQGLGSWPVRATGPDYTYYTTTAADGRYDLFVDTGTYNVQTFVPQHLWWGLCDSTGTAVLDTLFAADTVQFAALALADCPLMTVSLGIPQLRRCFDNAVYVQYCNQGTETADSAYVDLTLDPALSVQNANTGYVSLGNHVYRFPVGSVPPGQCGQFSLTVHVDCDSTVLGQTHCITAHGFPDTLCTPVPGWSGANLVATATCQDSIVQLHIENTGSAPSQPLDYIIIEDDVVMLQGTRTYQPGETFTMPQPANGSTWRIESEQEPGHPFSTLALAFTEGCGGFQSLGFINQFTVNGITPSWHTACLENIGAYDPNDKQGFPRGFGPENNIRPGQELEYRIRFQNTGTDTAFTVVLRDTLAPWLDPASVRVGAGSHAYTWALEGTGVLAFTFANILLPDSNVNEPASHGFVSFSIDQKPDVPAGTEILNSVAIYFDFNAPVITNQTLHTVAEEYLTGPTSHTASTTRQSSSVLIHPNPAVDATVVRPRDGAFAGERFTLTNAIGQVVHTATLRGREYRLVRGALPAGVYWWKVDGKASGSVIFK